MIEETFLKSRLSHDDYVFQLSSENSKTQTSITADDIYESTSTCARASASGLVQEPLKNERIPGWGQERHYPPVGQQKIGNSEAPFSEKILPSEWAKTSQLIEAGQEKRRGVQHPSNY
ncbi:hypothetical protein AVEN_217802-1 [Araneus ventricosus]|uniref:Uncharacterized protein n=1 Tax=Araneus ventricosus TaxID=182803 RepID=A0A4Y2HFC9_ARAVE|nr:hypothetical protein AVEN_217802-1 [Araneus ventricosus]